MRALRDVIPARVEKFSAAPDQEISIDPQLRLTWAGGPVARLLPGPDPLSPKVEPIASDLLDGPQREAVRLRCTSWIEARIRATLPDLMAARDAELSGPARGLVFQLSEKLGAMAREPAEEQIAAVSDEDRKALARVGVRVGVYTVYIPTMLKPAAIRMRGMLWAIANGREASPSLPGEGRTSIVMTPEMDRGFLAAVGYMPLGERAIRADIVERLAWAARQAVRASRDGQRKDREPQQAKQQPKGRRGGASDAVVVTEWMIAAAALGEDPGIAAPAPQAAVEPEPAPAPEPVDDGSALASRETDGSIPVPLAWSTSERRWIEFDENAKPKAPVLPPGHFRASAEMLSLVGCTEKEMAEILRDLGYRVHQPSEQTGPQPSFSMKPRFVREREERRGPDNREGRPQHRRRERRGDGERGPRPQDGAPRGERPPRPEGEQRPDRREHRPPRHRDGEAPAAGAARADQPRRDGPRQDGPRQDGPRREFPRRDGPRREGGRDRRDPGGPEFRLVASTEKKSDTPESDSPFAKLLELKLGKK
jgi:ATP-dependent RNA helicase SUPV3L1/SUV3